VLLFFRSLLVGEVVVMATLSSRVFVSTAFPPVKIITVVRLLTLVVVEVVVMTTLISLVVVSTACPPVEVNAFVRLLAHGLVTNADPRLCSITRAVWPLHVVRYL